MFEGGGRVRLQEDRRIASQVGIFVGGVGFLQVLWFSATEQKSDIRGQLIT